MPKHIKNTTTGQEMRVFYAFDGEKVRTVAPQGERTYLGGMEYLAGAKQHYTHAEGRMTYEVDHNVEKSFIQYKIADHLGNLMVLFGDKDGDRKINTETAIAADNSLPEEIVQRHFYYAYGMEMEGPWQHTPLVGDAYMYNGKELLGDLGMDLSDYGARYYDAVIGRWTGVDALSEKFANWTPYNYSVNNPIVFIDPNGKGPTHNILYIIATSNADPSVIANLQRDVEVLINAAQINVQVCMVSNPANFDITQMDPTDAIAVVGGDKEATSDFILQNLDKGYLSTGFKGQLSEGGQFRVEPSFINPETTDGGNSTTGNGWGYVVATTTKTGNETAKNGFTSSLLKSLNLKKNQATQVVALTIVHGLGHLAGIIHDIRFSPKEQNRGFMSEGLSDFSQYNGNIPALVMATRLFYKEVMDKIDNRFKKDESPKLNYNPNAE